MSTYVDAGTYSFYMGAYAQRLGWERALRDCDQFLSGDKTYVCLDDKFSIRKHHYPWYKENRKHLHQSTLDLQKFAWQWIKTAQTRYNHKIFISHYGLEADDLLAQYAIPGKDTVVSNDKDLLQIVGPRGERLSLMDSKMNDWGIERLQKHTKVHLEAGERALAYQLCHGDVADNIQRGLLASDRRSIKWIFQDIHPLAALCSGGPIPIPKLTELLNCLVVPTPLIREECPIQYVHEYYGIEPVHLDWEDYIKETQSWRLNQISK